MLLKEAMKQTGLSKKAILYYENNDFIHPHKLENGYRDYDEQCIEQLMYIRQLRNLGLNMERIRKILLEDAYAPQIYEEVIHEIDAKTNVLHKQKAILKQMMKHKHPDVNVMNKIGKEHPYFYTSHVGLLNGGIHVIIFMLFVCLYPVLPILDGNTQVLFMVMVGVFITLRSMLFQSIGFFEPKNRALNIKGLYILIVISILESLLLLMVLKGGLHVPKESMSYTYHSFVIWGIFLLFSFISIYTSFHPVVVSNYTFNSETDDFQEDE